MNPLPTAPEAVANSALRDRYFRDLKRWGFNVAYNAHYAYPLSAVQGQYRTIHEPFTRQAEQEGVPACVQIQSTVADTEDIPLRESQFYFNNTLQTYKHHSHIGTLNFFASFASARWRKHLKRLVDIYYEYGYRWVVFEEPMFRVDLPGTKDRFHEAFRKRYPGIKYPERHTESEAYRRVQVFKQDLLIEFIDDVCSYAKKIGFEKAGVMPWFFSPTHENTPEETWCSSCDLGRVHHLDSVDFIVVRMQPDNIYGGAMTEQDGVALPWLSYLENLAHQGGKPIIAVNNPSNEHLPAGSEDYWVLPDEFFSRYTLAAAAAAPAGMTRHWYGKNYGRDLKAMALYEKINPLLTRLGGASSPLGLVYSYRGLIHAMPRSAKQLWTPYSHLAGELLYESKVPFLTLYADSLRKGLERAPELRTLVIFEEYPISPEEIALLRRWVSAGDDRNLVLFARGRGQAYDLERNPFDYSELPPELVELFGLRVDRPFRLTGCGETARIEFAGSNPKDAFLGKAFDWRCYGWGSGAFKKSKSLEVIYADQRTGIPVITRLNYPKGGKAWLIAQGLEGPRGNFPFAEFLRNLSEDGPEPFPRVESSSDVLWSQTRNRFLVASNTSPEPGWMKIEGCQGDFWDVQRKRFESKPDAKKTLAGSEIRLYRLVEKDDPILDVEGQVFLGAITLAGKRVRIEGYFRRTTRIRIRRAPVQIRWQGAEQPFQIKRQRGYLEIELELDRPGEGVWELIFD